MEAYNGGFMILIKASSTILQITSDPLNLIELSGRCCYKSEAKITEESKADFAKMILKRGHESVLEHASASVRFICDRGISHEIVRHRIASYSQESTRYCDYTGGHIAFIIPPWVEVEPGMYDEHWAKFINREPWLSAMWASEQSYKELRAMGWKPEQARSVLPNSLKTEIVMTANLREWRHFFKLRTAPAAHPQMREVAIPLLKDMSTRIPIIFDDLL
jgi:thymidylate synthase (FAD)